MNTKKLLFQTCLCNLLILGSDGWRPFTAEFTNISSQSFVNYVETNSSISSRGLVSLYFNVLQSILNLAEFTNISSQSFVNYVETNSSISSRGLVSLYFNVLQSILNLYTKVLIMVDTSHGIYDLELVNKTIDSCEFLKNPRYEPITQVFYRILAKNGSFPKSCPITKKLYFVKDVLMDPENLPRVMPWKGLFADITMMTKTGNTFKTLGAYKIHAQIE